MPTKKLPASPNLNHLKHQARDLMSARPSGDLPTLQRIREFHPRFSRSADSEIAAAKFSLSDAQLTIAREHGFASWPRLHAFLAKPTDLERPLMERIDDPEFRDAVEMLDAGDLEGLESHLANHPRLKTATVLFEGGNYFREPTLLEFCAENPIRSGRLPANIVAVVRFLLEAGCAGANMALSLVCSGSVPRECGVQDALVELMCQFGADPDGAMGPALAHGEFGAAEALLKAGAELRFDTAAAMGKTVEARALLAEATPEDRHRGLGYAANFGHAKVVQMLLDFGVDPNRYNPVGGHSHATPLHQAAFFGHLDVVQVFLDFGARLDIKDVLWQGTPLEWAEHGGQTETAAMLRAKRGKERIMNNGPMTAQEIVEQLRPMGRESYRKTMLKHGVHEPLLGVSIGDMQPIRKKIRKDYQLAKDLYATGIYDAMYLGGLVADEEKMTAADLENWMRNSKCHAIATSTVAAVAAESVHGWELGLKWIDVADETIQSAGWATLSGVLSLRDNADLDLEAIRGLMERIGKAIHSQNDGIKYSMNNFVISVGAYVEPLAKEAMKVAEANGKMPIDLVGDCKMPFAPEYIKKCQERGSLSKKKKMVRC